MVVSPLLLWMSMVIELLDAGARLLEIGRRVQAGEEITPEELQAAKDETVAAIERWGAAAEHDKPA